MSLILQSENVVNIKAGLKMSESQTGNMVLSVCLFFNELLYR